MENWAVAALAMTAIIVLLAALMIVDARMLPAEPWRRSLATSLACAAAGTLSWLALGPIVASGLPAGLFLPVALLGGVATFLTTLAARGSGADVLVTVVFALLWGALVFVPTAALSFSTLGVDVAGIDPLDHGGSLALNVAAGAGALGVLLANGRRAPRPRAASITLPWGVAGVVALCLGWIGWLVGAELAIDEATPVIIANAVIGALGGMAGWLVVQRMRHQSTTLAAVAAGILSGLVAVTAGAPLFTPVSAAAAGVFAGGAACIFTLARVGASRRQQWFVVGSHLIAGAVGILILGLFGTGMGFLFTGQVDLVQAQVTGTALVVAYSCAVSFVLWAVLRRLPSRSKVLA